MFTPCLFSPSRQAKLQFFGAWFLDASIGSAQRNQWRQCASSGQMIKAEILEFEFRNHAPGVAPRSGWGAASTSVRRQPRLSRLSWFRMDSIHDPEDKAYQHEQAKRAVADDRTAKVKSPAQQKQKDNQDEPCIPGCHLTSMGQRSHGGLPFVTQFNLCREMGLAFSIFRVMGPPPAIATAFRGSMRLTPGNHFADNVANTPAAVHAFRIGATDVLTRRTPKPKMALLRILFQDAEGANQNHCLQNRDHRKRLGKRQGLSQQRQSSLNGSPPIHYRLPCLDSRLTRAGPSAVSRLPPAK